MAKPVASLRRFGETQQGANRECLLIAKMQPFIALFTAIAIGEAGPVLVADEEQISEHIHALALLSVAEKRAHRQFQVLSKQVNQRAFNGRSRVNCHALIECLRAPSRCIAISKLTQYTLDDPVMVGDVGV